MTWVTVPASDSSTSGFIHGVFFLRFLYHKKDGRVPPGLGSLDRKFSLFWQGRKKHFGGLGCVRWKSTAFENKENELTPHHYRSSKAENANQTTPILAVKITLTTTDLRKFLSQPSLQILSGRVLDISWCCIFVCVFGALLSSTCPSIIVFSRLICHLVWLKHLTFLTFSYFLHCNKTNNRRGGSWRDHIHCYSMLWPNL